MSHRFPQNRNDFMTQALVFDPVTRQAYEALPAAQYNKEQHENHQMICSQCWDMGSVTRLNHRPRGKYSPDRYVLYKGEDSVHRCDHPVRYKALRTRGARYGGREITDNNWRFPVEIPGVGVDVPNTDIDPFWVHSAERLMKLTQDLMHDPDLRAQQSLKFPGDMTAAFNDAVFERPKTLAPAALKGGMKYAAVIFQPTAPRHLWGKNFIPAPRVVVGDIKVSTRLLYANDEIGGNVRALLNQGGHNKGNKVFVVAPIEVRDSRMNDGRKIIELDVSHNAQFKIWQRKHSEFRTYYTDDAQYRFAL